MKRLDADNSIEEQSQKDLKQKGKRKALSVAFSVSAVVGLTTLMVLGVKKGVVKSPIKLSGNIMSNSDSANNVIETIEVITDAYDALTPTGQYLTATGLGEKMHVSAQTVNKRLVGEGLATREPYGLKLTELGKKFGKETIETTRWGYSFRNLEWDSSLFEALFSSEEKHLRGV